MRRVKRIGVLSDVGAKIRSHVSIDPRRELWFRFSLSLSGPVARLVDAMRRYCKEFLE